jgi:hypothetical protein
MKIEFGDEETRCENIYPYTAFGNIGAWFAGKSFTPRTYDVKATPHAQDGCSGDEGPGLSGTLNVNAPCSYMFWNAETEALVIENSPSQGEILCAQAWEYNIIPTDCDPDVKSVHFELFGPNGYYYYTDKREIISPYTTFGNVGNTFFGQPWLLGNFTIKAALYGNDYFDNELYTMEVDFSVKDCADESITGDHTCHINAHYQHTEGGFTCQCNEGYGGDGYSCNTCFKTNTELKAAVRKYAANNASDTDVAQTYGKPIGEWCFRYVEDFTLIFYGCGNEGLRAFNENISKWDVTNAKSMYNVFHFANFFNSDISSWNVSKVNKMYFILILIYHRGTCPR